MQLPQRSGMISTMWRFHSPRLFYREGAIMWPKDDHDMEINWYWIWLLTFWHGLSFIQGLLLEGILRFNLICFRRRCATPLSDCVRLIFVECVHNVSLCDSCIICWARPVIYNWHGLLYIMGRAQTWVRWGPFGLDGRGPIYFRLGPYGYVVF